MQVGRQSGACSQEPDAGPGPTYLIQDLKPLSYIPWTTHLLRESWARLHLSLAGDRLAEDLDGGVRDVVVRRNHAQVQRLQVHVVLHRHHAGGLQVRQRALDQVREVVRQVPVARALRGEQGQGRVKDKAICLSRVGGPGEGGHRGRA